MGMRGFTRRWLRMLAAPLLLAGAMAGLMMPPASAVTCQGWTGGQPPSPASGTELQGVTAVSECDLWAVGSAIVPNQNDAFATATVIEHWTGGSTWTVVKSPSPGDGSELSGVAAVSAKDVWAVGAFVASDSTRILIEHWDGTAWRQVSVPSPGAGFDRLSAVTAVSSTNVWAVGTFDAFDRAKQQVVEHPLTMHWNGTAWRQVPSPSPSSPDGITAVPGVSAASASNIWAVGYFLAGSSSDTARTLALHWNGTAWRRVTSPTPGITSHLFGVSVLSATNAWAVGDYTTAGGNELSLILHWNGTAWAQVPSPSPGTGPHGGTALFGITAIAPSNVWAVGVDAFGQALTVHWDGSSWQVVGTAIPRNPSELQAVTATPAGFVWTVGESGASLTDTQPLAVPVQGQPRVQMAVQGRDGLLYEAGPVSGVAGNGLTMLAGTSPALTENAGGGTEIAWVGANRDLWTLDPAGHQTDTGLAADPGSSPAITALAGGGFEIAWVSNGQLLERGPDGTARAAGNGLAVTPGTSPAIAADGSGGFEIAFSAAGSGTLTTVDQDNTVTATGSRVAGTTSPAITALDTGGYEIAFKNNADGLLWTLGPGGTPVRASDGLGVADGTTPVIAAAPGGGFEIAFHADGLNDLWTVDPSNLNHETHLPMAPGTSPAIAPDPGGGFDLAIHAVGSDDLLTVDPGLNNSETSVAMGTLTSPAMAAPAVFPTSTIVPNVISTDEQTQAEPSITKAGLTVGTITPNNQCRDVAGTVLNQDPAPGASVPLGTPVNMTVSTGTDAQGHKCVFD